MSGRSRSTLVLSALLCGSVLCLAWFWTGTPSQLDTARYYDAVRPKTQGPVLASAGAADLQSEDVKPKLRTFISYAYYETPTAKPNLEYFLRHALHDAADFVVSVNGPSTVEFPDLPNLRVVYRDNTCYDLGTHGEILREGGENAPVRIYDRFILLNGSIRGPFLPRWGKSRCWSDNYLDRLDDKLKLVGMTASCSGRRHVQSMIIATDRIGAALLEPVFKCYESFQDAVINGEMLVTRTIMNGGYQAEPLMAQWASLGKTNPEAWANCFDKDPTRADHSYAGMDLHPYDAMFVKTNRRTSEDGARVVDRLTDWARLSNFSSYDHCH